MGKEVITDSAYIETMKNCSKWNSRTINGRTRSKTAVYDQQTGIVHRPTEHLFRHKSERFRSQNPMQVYSYPPVQWTRSKNAPSASVEMNYFLKINPALKNAVFANVEMPQQQFSNETSGVAIEQQQVSSIPTRGNSTKNYDGELDFADYDMEDLDANDQSDEDDWGASRKKRKKAGAGAPGSTSANRSSRRPAVASATKKELQQPDSVSSGTPGSTAGVGSGATSGNNGGGGSAEPRPFVCQLCGAKYKSRPGLTYHRIHVHQSDTNGETPKSPIISNKVQVSDYCDFCLGNSSQNPDGEPEGLISCHDCGRSGHPSCLKFTKNMLVSTKRFGWQCIECKSCAICGTSENDDQLLFCDDCDRGFHLYCLKPPLKAPPDTDWSCHLCIQQFGAEASFAKASLKGSG